MSAEQTLKTVTVSALLNQLMCLIRHGHVTLQTPVVVGIGERVGYQMMPPIDDKPAMRETTTYCRTFPATAIGFAYRVEQNLLMVVVENVVFADDDGS
jgi:hypothetical protein